MSLRIYISSPMTGRSGTELLKQAALVQNLARQYGVEVLDPIVAEKVEEGQMPLANTLEKLQGYWKRDKEMLRQSHVMIDLSGSRNSEGCKHELGYMRYFLWRPVIRVYPGLVHSVTAIDSDFIANDLTHAFRIAVRMWGSPFKRLLWTIQMMSHSWYRVLWTRASMLWWWI